MTNQPIKITPTLRRWLDFIGRSGDKGRMLLQITSSGGRSASQLQSLINAGYVEIFAAPYVEHGRFEPDRVRLTTSGRTAYSLNRV